MSTWTAQTTVMGHPQDVLGVLTDPAACGRWAPIDFDVEGLEGDRLVAGSRAHVVGRLAGQRVSFEVNVIAADTQRLALCASGPITLDVLYELEHAADATEVTASIGVRRGNGLVGRLLAQATDAVLAGGALRASMAAIAREAEACPA
jgi:hypothetical protein